MNYIKRTSTSTIAPRAIACGCSNVSRMLLIGPNGILTEHQETDGTTKKYNAPKSSELVNPMISVLLLKHIRDNLNEFGPVFHTCAVA
jgi:hypothetical protein